MQRTISRSGSHDSVPVSERSRKTDRVDEGLDDPQPESKRKRTRVRTGKSSSYRHGSTGLPSLQAACSARRDVCGTHLGGITCIRYAESPYAAVMKKGIRGFWVKSQSAGAEVVVAWVFCVLGQGWKTRLFSPQVSSRALLASRLRRVNTRPHAQTRHRQVRCPPA